MIAFPFAATVVSLAFAGALFVQYARRKRFHQLVWGIALVQFGIASIAVAAGVGSGWDPTAYKIYWVFGAMLNVPWLALGSISLLGKKWLTVVATVAVVVGSVWGLAQVIGATPVIADPELLPRGKDAWANHPDVRALATYYSYPAYVVVVGIAVWTSRRRKGLRPARERVVGNWLISLGVTIVAVGGAALARLANGSVFSVTLAVGIAVMYAGFLLASRAPRFTVEEPGDAAT